MKIRKLFLAASLSLFFLTACQPEVTETDNPAETSEEIEEDESTAVSRNQLGSDYYRPALDAEGHYLTSQNRGITLNLNSGINLNLFEKDLIRLSQEQFPTGEYFIREGQYLPEKLVRSWIGRKSEKNPEGLNPAEEGEGDDRVPRYLNSILELDFYKESEEGVDLSGMSIGLALNTVDYYTAVQFGPTLEQEINEEKILEEGKRIANEVLRRIREMEDLEEIPVMISLYKQAPRDDLAGGVHVVKGSNTTGSTAVDNWKEINEERKIYPLAGQSSAEGNAFANFQSEVEAFFPNVSGITGRAHYINERLDSLAINIMTQFYGETEMISYTQYLKQSAATYLPADIEIEIVVESPGGVEAFLEKGPADAEFYYHVFD